MQRDRLYVEEMLEAAVRAQEIAGDATVDELIDDRLRHEALLWNFTVLGEAAARVSDELKARHPDVAWRRPADTRNRIVHGYWSIDLEILHTTVSEHLPGLVKALRVVLDEISSQG